MEMYRLIQEKMKIMQMDPKFAERYLNEGFSGGEKKRNEILQMLMLEPKLAIMDETDSGLDIDALQVVVQGRQRAAGAGVQRGHHHALPEDTAVHRAGPRPRHARR